MATRGNIQTQLARSRHLLPIFREAAATWSIPVHILLAVASRETQIGTDPYYLNNEFTGRDGHGKGIIQIDDRFHQFALVTAPNNHQRMINYGAQFLSELRDRFGNLKDALSAYNAGPDDVDKAKRIGMDPDTLTTGGDYAADVMRRAEIIKDELGLGASKTLALAPAVAAFLVGVGYLITEYVKTNN